MVNMTSNQPRVHSYSASDKLWIYSEDYGGISPCVCQRAEAAQSLFLEARGSVMRSERAALAKAEMSDEFMVK